MSVNESELAEKALGVLTANDRGNYTVPAGHLYPHQWLWDSCFIAIGLVHHDVERAKREILELLQGQWSNGMVPNMVFKGNNFADRQVWQSSLSPYAPSDQATSGITQPPVIAEAVWRIGQKLRPAERRAWYHAVYPQIVAYHQWLYRERDPHHEGLIILVHPWESGLDNSPYWLSAMRENRIPFWIKLIDYLPLDGIINRIRKDTRYVRSAQRSSTLEVLMNHHVQQRLKAKGYSSEKILTRSHFSVQDVAFNSILVRANTQLEQIARAIKEDLPEDLRTAMHKSEAALLELWDDHTGMFFSRNFITQKLFIEPTITTFLPLYAMKLPETQQRRLVSLLKSHSNWLNHPVPSVPSNSHYFSPTRYWQGPTWINTNWLIIDGLETAGEKELADKLRRKTLDLVSKSGFAEYFNPATGDALGAQNFSWTAALTLDLMSTD